MIAFLKKLVKKLPVRFTKNQRYDHLTRTIIKRFCERDSNYIDVGTHKGEILDLFLKQCPGGIHFGFEPIPALFETLQKKYAGRSNCRLFQLALSNQKSTTSFNYVLSNPAYSGIKKRVYDRKQEKDQLITVQTDRLDNVIPDGLPVRLIKIDVEGGEMDVLEGAEKVLSGFKPLVIFECGLGGSDIYGTTPERVFDFFSSRGYRIFLLDAFVRNKPALTREALADQFYNRKNYYFIAA